MSLAETQRAASPCITEPRCEWARSCSAASECELQGTHTHTHTQKKRGCLPFTMGQVHSLKTNGWESLGFQSQE